MNFSHHLLLFAVFMGSFGWLAADAVAEQTSDTGGVVQTTEGRNADKATLAAILRNPATTASERRDALQSFREKQLGRREGRVPRQTAEEKAESLRQLHEKISSMPDGARKARSVQVLARAQAMENFHSIPPAERAARLQQLREQRQQTIQAESNAIAAPSVRESSAGSTDPFVAAFETERHKLDQALKDGTSAEKQVAVKEFREALHRLRQERRKSAEQLQKQIAP